MPTPHAARFWAPPLTTSGAQAERDDPAASQAQALIAIATLLLVLVSDHEPTAPDRAA